MNNAVRQLWKNPGFTFVVVTTLALGIGANTAMFSVINATMLQPLPYLEPERLVRVWETTPRGMNFSASEPNYLDFRDRSSGFSELAAYKGTSLSLTGSGEPARLDGLAVTDNYFATLGSEPALGRTFAADDTAVVILSDAVVRQRFDGTGDVVGRDIVLEGRAHTVVGVMPADFRDLQGAALWVPLQPKMRADRGDHWLGIIGRLAPGVSVGQAEAELNAIAATIGEVHPAVAGWGARIASFSDWLIGSQFRVTAYLLSAAVGLLLLMACANLANLLFARASRRESEFGVRAALGAGRRRLVRQLLGEALVLTALGVVAGLIVASLAIAALQAFGPEGIPAWNDIRLDTRVFAFTVALGLVTSVAFGLGPALRASRVDLNAVLKQGSRGAVSREHRRLGNALVVVQVALAMVLLAGAGLLMKSFMQLQGSDPGFDARQVVAVELQLGDANYREPWQKVVFFRQLVERVSGLPGVVSAGAGISTPFGDMNFMNDVTPVERAAEVGPSGYLQAAWRVATPGFFETLGMPLLRGRVFGDGDAWDGPRLVVVTDTMAQQMWPGEDAVGRQLYWGGVDGTPLTVVGVVGDYQDVQIGATPPPLMFLPHNQLPWGGMTLLVKAVGDTDALSGALRDVIRSMDPLLPVPTIVPLSQQLSDAVAAPRFRTALLAAFAAVALLLAAVGIYGLMAFNVNQRRREVGLRIALGAVPESVTRSFLSGGARLVALGATLGLVGTWVMSRFLDSLLYATAPLDPIALASAAALLTVVALAASYFPARRAARVDPMEALRDE